MTSVPSFANFPKKLVEEYVNGKKYWSVSYNNNGAILKRRAETIYLGIECDVLSKRYGGGRWGQANGGVIVQFRKSEIVFPRQSVGTPPIDCEIP